MYVCLCVSVCQKKTSTKHFQIQLKIYKCNSIQGSHRIDFKKIRIIEYQFVLLIQQSIILTD